MGDDLRLWRGAAGLGDVKKFGSIVIFVRGAGLGGLGHKICHVQRKSHYSGDFARQS